EPRPHHLPPPARPSGSPPGGRRRRRPAAGGRARRAARAHGLRAHPRLDGRGGRRRPPWLRLRGGDPHGDGLPGGPRAAGRGPGLRSDRARRPAARVGDERARPRPAPPRLRAGPHGARLRARRPHGDPDVPLRRAQPGRARAARAQPAPPVPRGAHRRRLLPAVPGARRGGDRRRPGRHQRLGRRRGLGRDRGAQAGEVDVGAALAPGRARARRGRRRLRLPRRPRPAGPGLDAVRGARMGLPPVARAPAPVAPVPALQPALRRGLRPAVARGPGGPQL
ncbi:MAG: N-acetylmannosaminyltransferase, partial [uncultured Solirubrobacteraceae bacterium]